LAVFVGMKYSLAHMCKTASVLYLRLMFTKQMLTSCEIMPHVSLERCPTDRKLRSSCKSQKII